MRFINFIVALSGVASVASELQDLNDRNVVAGETFAARGAPSANVLDPQLDARAKPKKSTTKAKGTDAASCKPKRSRFMPRALEKSQVSAKTGDTWLLYEDQWVTAVKVKSGDKVAVTDVSGCTAVFFWNSANVPSTFHLFCGTDLADGATAAADLAEMGGVTPVHVTIAADGQAKYNSVVEVIKKEFAELESDKDFTPMVYNSKDLKSDQRYRYDAVAGTRAVKKTTIAQSSCSRQNAGKV